MKTRVYLDNCCLNRPFDDSCTPLVRLEIEAKNHIQRQILEGNKDALHLACALAAQCHYFLTTDKKILKKRIEGITLMNPVEYIQKVEG